MRRGKLARAQGFQLCPIIPLIDIIKNNKVHKGLQLGGRTLASLRDALASPLCFAFGEVHERPRTDPLFAQDVQSYQLDLPSGLAVGGKPRRCPVLGILRPWWLTQQAKPSARFLPAKPDVTRVPAEDGPLSPSGKAPKLLMLAAGSVRGRPKPVR